MSKNIIFLSILILIVASMVTTINLTVAQKYDGYGYQKMTIGPYDTVVSGRKTVTSAGTAEQLPSNGCKRLVVQALINNTNEVVLGDASVVAAEGTRQGVALSAGQALTFYVSDSSVLYADVETSGEGVNFFCEN